MIPVEEMVVPDKVTDLPVEGLKQFDGKRNDRLNDLTQQQVKEKQQESLEVKANNEADEAKDEEKLANVRSLEHEQIVQKTKADKKRKLMQDQAQAVGNPNLLEDEGEAEARQARSARTKAVGTKTKGEGQAGCATVL